MRRQLQKWENQCLYGHPEEIGGVSFHVFHTFLVFYAKNATLRVTELCNSRILPESVIRLVLAAAFGAVRYMIHAGTTWTPRLASVTGYQLDQLKTAIRWMLHNFTPKELRSWERKTEK
jgi:hypothetical protein